MRSLNFSFFGVLIILAFCGCTQKLYTGNLAFYFKSKEAKDCFSLEQIEKIRLNYYEEIDSMNNIYISTYVNSNNNSCSGLFYSTEYLGKIRSDHRIGPSKPILLSNGTLFLHSGNDSTDRETVQLFLEKHLNEFDEFNSGRIQNFFMSGRIQFFLH